MLDQMGLAPALQWFIDGFKSKSNIHVTLELPANLGRLPGELETATFRIVQEALTNIHRHSNSATAAISLQRHESNLSLRIRDEGKGIPREALSKIERGFSPGVGLRGMRERVENLGGQLEISSPGKGTQISVVIPLTSDRQSSDG
jgi:signal transduction histidine kinase